MELPRRRKSMDKFQKIKQWYDTGLWTKQQVLDAVGRWITNEEALEILGESN